MLFHLLRGHHLVIVSYYLLKEGYHTICVFHNFQFSDSSLFHSSFPLQYLFPSCLQNSSFHEICQVFQSCISQFCLLTLVCRLVTLCCFACSKRRYLEIIIDFLLRFVLFIPVIVIIIFFNLRYLPFNNYKVIQPVIIIIFRNCFLGFLGLCSRFSLLDSGVSSEPVSFSDFPIR